MLNRSKIITILTPIDEVRPFVGTDVCILDNMASIDTLNWNLSRNDSCKNKSKLISVDKVQGLNIFTLHTSEGMIVPTSSLYLLEAIEDKPTEDPLKYVYMGDTAE